MEALPGVQQVHHIEAGQTGKRGGCPRLPGESMFDALEQCLNLPSSCGTEIPCRNGSLLTSRGH